MLAYDFHADRLPSDQLAKVDQFWNWFQANADGLDAHFTRSTDRASTEPNELIDRLKGPWDDLMWEFGPSKGGHSLAITAEWNDTNLVLARAFLRRAPSLPRWEFTDVRPACDADTLLETFEVMFEQPLHITAVKAAENDAGRVDITVEGTDSEDVLFDQAIKLTSLLLGEKDERDWLGMIGCTQLKVSRGVRKLFKPKKLDVEEAQACLSRAIAQSKAKQPEYPYAQTNWFDSEVSLFKITDAPEDHVRADLITFVAADQRYAIAAINTPRFSSANHSNHGECFVYLRLPNWDGGLFCSDERGRIEELIYGCLTAEDLGGVVAAGTGREAAYIDVALTDVTAGLARLGQILAGEPFFPEATVHFLDPGLAEYAHPLLGFAEIEKM